MAIYKLEDLLNKHNVTADQVTTFGSPESIQNSMDSLNKKKEESFLGGLKQDLDTRVDRTGDILNREDSSIAEKGVQLFGQGAGLAANAIEKTVEQIPGVKQTFGAIGSGINWLATSDYSPAKMLGDKIGKSKALQEVTMLYDTDQNFKDSVDAVANIARLGGDVQMASDALNLTKNVASKIKTKIGDTLPPDGITNVVKEKASSLVPKSDEIMQRVARISKGKQAKFEKMSGGESVGGYLTKRGIFGDIDEITTKLYDRFTKSMNEADEGFTKLKGTFNPEPVGTALKELVARETRVSSPGAISPNLNRVKELLGKFEGKGLDMSEINEVKRLFEKNVKVDYLKSVSSNPEGVVRATNLDSAIRNWQTSQAETLGMKNLGAVNRETRLAKQLLDDIGQEYAGAAGNNAMTLTDWIMLSGGDPTAISGFLVKKTLSSKGVQSSVAKYLNKGKATMGDVKADIGTSQVKQLPAPKAGTPKSQVNVPINQPSRKAIQQGTEIVPSSSKKSTQLLEGKSKRKASSIVSPNESKVNTVKELQNYDTTPMKVNGKLDFANTDREFRIDQLKAKKKLTNADIKEAQTLLKESGIDITTQNAKKINTNNLSKKAIEANELLENNGYTIADLLNPKKQVGASDILAANGFDYGKIANELSKTRAYATKNIPKVNTPKQVPLKLNDIRGNQMDIGENVKGVPTLTTEKIEDVFRDFGIRIEKRKYYPPTDGNEGTFSFKFKKPLTDLQAFELSKALQQDAIQIVQGNIGKLHGPGNNLPDYGGRFNRKYFKGLK